MSARRIAYAMVASVLAASGAYVFVYLYRWEWNRALMAGVLFVAAEVALAAALILDRLRSLEPRARNSGVTASRARDSRSRLLRTREPAGQGGPVDPHVLARIGQTTPASRNHFQWLTRDAETLNVFVPVLMGAGVVLSGLAWIVERLAHATARPALERGLATRLAPLSLPHDGLVGVEEDRLSILVGPQSSRE
jgi:hypothetical protein